VKITIEQQGKKVEITLDNMDELSNVVKVLKEIFGDEKTTFIPYPFPLYPNPYYSYPYACTDNYYHLYHSHTCKEVSWV